jgi:RCC1 and BTB domain-containing protein
MWGHCRGHSIFSPSLTPYTHLDEVFACYSTPAVTWRTLQFRARQDTPLAETLRLAFNDEVKHNWLSFHLKTDKFFFNCVEHGGLMLQSSWELHLGA